MASLQELKQYHNIQDSNDSQELLVDACEPIRYAKLTFKDFSDFYGRIIIYTLDIYGTIVE